MKSFAVILKNKRKEALTDDLLNMHVKYVKQLYKEGVLKLCGPFTDNDGALMIFNCHKSEDVQHFLANDPFIKEKYYGTYEVTEFIEANDENNWLLDIPQTQKT
ncbi:YciI family protein [Fictibacillus gelatini]|uniref:YciI family protein n=1 Tax=Fictibacillus gelatini TaxID=225985 RepID=UPI000404E3CD|nr:YciI family protein [Fictibacillus gelatini]